MWKSKIDKKCNLSGPYPEILNLCSEHYLELDFSLEPKIVIADDKNVKRIIAPSDQIGISYILIKDLPNLEEVVIQGGFHNSFQCLQWVALQNCPVLEKVSVEGDVISLAITGSASLEFLDISGCKAIDHVVVSPALERLKIDARGCLKLREVIGLNDDLQISSGLLDQISENQKSSRLDGNIYDCMTLTDIDLVKDLINEGVKALSRIGQLPSENGLIAGFYGLQAMEKNFIPYDFRILSPLETVYTGGTGETYGYVSMERSSSTEVIIGFGDEVAGNKSPEDCLRYMLHSIRMLASHLPQVNESTNQDLLEFLRSSHQSIKDNEVLGYPVKLSPYIEEEKKIELVKLISESGIRFADKDSKDIACITSESCDFTEDQDFFDYSSIDLTASEAINQLQEIWYWKFKGKTICLAGKLSIGKKKKEYKALIESAGFKRVEEIRKGLSFLAHEEPGSTAKKVVQARKLGIEVISEQGLLALLKSDEISGSS